MFSGPDYNQQFEEACAELPGETDPDMVRRNLMSIEWVLWEAIRGVFGHIALCIAALIVLPPFYLLDARQSWTTGLIILGLLLLLTLAIYWLCRAIFHYEIGRHVRGRRFGEGGFGHH